MSPEQVLSAKSVDFRTDLWALGVVAYFCLTGGVPFTGETLGSLCVSIAGGTFRPPSELRAGLPAAVDAWMLRALSLDPEGRFANAKQMAVQFAQALSGQHIEDEFSTTDVSLPGLSDASGRFPRADPSASGAHMAQADASGPTAALGGALVAAPAQTHISPTFTGTAITHDDEPGRKRRGLVAMAAIAVLGLGVGIGSVAFLSAEAPESTATPAQAGDAAEGMDDETAGATATTSEPAEAVPSEAVPVAADPSPPTSSSSSPEGASAPPDTPRAGVAAPPPDPAEPAPAPPPVTPPPPTSKTTKTKKDGDRYGF